MKSLYTSPCLSCPIRYVGCHSDCEPYLEFSKKCEAERAARLQALEANAIIQGQDRRKRFSRDSKKR